MNSFTVSPGGLPSLIELPASKSYANRALILAARKTESITLHRIPEATDVTILIECLKQVGLEIVGTHQQMTISGSFPNCEGEGECSLQVGEGGTTARFLASLLVLGSRPYRLHLGSRLKDRPWHDFLTLLKEMGGKARLDGHDLYIQGPIKVTNIIEVDCSKTSQFATGLALALGFNHVDVVPKNLKSSPSYWLMTKELIKYFKNHNQYTIPLDWSSASYPLAFAALSQEILFPGLTPDPFQADGKLFEILKEMNAIEITSTGIKVHPLSYKGNFTLDASDCLDLVPTLSFLFSHIQGTHKISGIKNLIFKESNRLEQIVKLLRTLGIKVDSEENQLCIYGKENLHISHLDLELPDDHRMVMTAALFLRMHRGGRVSPANAVKKSYPHFFQLLSKN
jgi:3-phosphoshikimate 1-carboxyvinyltransferase